DGNALGLGFFRHDTGQIDVQQAIDQRGALHFDVVRQTERQLEGPLGDALVQVSDLLAITLALATSQAQHASLDLQFQIRLMETGRRHHNAVGIVATLLDVVGRVGTAAIVAQGRLEEVVEAIKTDGLTEQGCHGYYSAHAASPDISKLVRVPFTASPHH